MTESVFITGANRGIGLQLTRLCLRGGAGQIYAACRAPDSADDLNALAAASGGRVSVLRLDINDSRQIQAAVDVVAAGGHGLDWLINNAGIYPKGEHQSFHLGALSAHDVAQVVVTNAVAPLMLTQALRHLLRQAERPRVVMISSGMGSLTNAGPGSYAYRMSKAAMNMAARLLAMDAEMRGVVTVAAHPGWVSTDMGGPNAAITPAESASRLIALIKTLSAADNGKFLLYDGSELAW